MPGSDTLPAGFRASSWPALDPAARSLYLEEFLVINPNLEVVGGVDYESSLEPVLTDKTNGDRISLAGEVVSSGSTGLVVPIIDGQLQSAGLIWAIAFAGLALLVYFESRK